MRLYVINVGVNANDAQKYQLRSPIFSDRSFEFVPIRESERFSEVGTIPRYCDLPSWTGRWNSLARLLPEKQSKALVHHDPDFEYLTYGDIPSSRGAALKGAEPGDQLWFLARLWEHDGSRFLGGSGFFFVGVFVVEANLLFENGIGDCPTALRARLESNAHWHRREAGDCGTFRVLFGSSNGSRRFCSAIEVTPGLAEHLFASSYDPQTGGFASEGQLVRNKNGKPRFWRHFGSITRTVQWFLDSNQPSHREHLAVLDSLAKKAGSATQTVPGKLSSLGRTCRP